MAAKEGVPVETERTAHHTDYMSGGKNPATTQQPHMNDNSSSSRISSNLTPVFDREDNHKHPDIVYNDASSSEESDYNQAAVIFSLDELQNSFTELPSSISPEVPPVDHRSSAGLLFPSLIQDEDEKISVSSKEDEEESDQNNDEFNLGSSPPADHPIKHTANTYILHDNVALDNKVTECSTQEVNSVNTEPQPDVVVPSDDTLLYHINSSIAGVDSTAISAVPLDVSSVPSDVSSVPVTAHPNSLVCTTHVEDFSLVDVALDDNLHDIGKLSPANVSPSQVETPHVETSSDIVTITPIETPTATSHRSLSGTELLGETELANSVSSSLDNTSLHHEKPIDPISMSGSMASGSGSKRLPEKLKPTQNAFESPGLLYAHPVKKSSKQVVETLEPAEPATEALLAEEKLPVTASHDSHHVKAKTDKRGEIFIHQTHLPSFTYKNLTGKVFTR